MMALLQESNWICQRQVTRILWTSSFLRVGRTIKQHHFNKQEIKSKSMVIVDPPCNYLKLRNYLWNLRETDHHQILGLVCKQQKVSKPVTGANRQCTITCKITQGPIRESSNHRLRQRCNKNNSSTYQFKDKVTRQWLCQTRHSITSTQNYRETEFIEFMHLREQQLRFDRVAEVLFGYIMWMHWINLRAAIRNK